MKGYETCACCGKAIAPGDEYYMSDLLGESMFCSPECMKKEIIESPQLNSVVDEWMEDHAECYDLESDDPYDLYGVSEGDF